jgi:hypothetical protein
VEQEEEDQEEGLTEEKSTVELLHGLETAIVRVRKGAALDAADEQKTAADGAARIVRRGPAGAVPPDSRCP